MAKAAISLGANLGERAQNLRRAVAALTAHADIRLLALSSLYETEPVDLLAQPLFINAAALIDTTLSPEKLLAWMQQIENKMGRVRDDAIEKGPRTLDLDLLLYDDEIRDAPELILPHPRMAERRFVLEPLNEIAAEMRHPILDKRVDELLALCEDTARVTRYNGY